MAPRASFVPKIRPRVSGDAEESAFFENGADRRTKNATSSSATSSTTYQLPLALLPPPPPLYPEIVVPKPPRLSADAKRQAEIQRDLRETIRASGYAIMRTEIAGDVDAKSYATNKRAKKTIEHVFATIGAPSDRIFPREILIKLKLKTSKAEQVQENMYPFMRTARQMTRLVEKQYANTLELLSKREQQNIERRNQRAGVAKKGFKEGNIITGNYDQEDTLSDSNGDDDEDGDDYTDQYQDDDDEDHDVFGNEEEDTI